MGAIAFYMFYCINWVVTLLPLRVLYFFSDILFLLLYYFPGYRRKVTAMNLRNSFPDKTEDEIKEIERRFYRHFADLFIETLKLAHLSNNQLKKRVTVTNPDLINIPLQTGRDLLLINSHYNNWEWVTCLLPSYTKINSVGVYKPLQNKYFDSFLNRFRTRNGGSLVPMAGILRTVIENYDNNQRTAYGFIADQTPAKPFIKYRTTFLNQLTPVHLGPEKIAEKYDMSVAFMNVRKVRRGYYSLTIEMLFENTRSLPEHIITDTHVRRLEEIIRENPEYWIWTHRRWKYSRIDD